MTNDAPLALHVPEPAVRPGDLPDFTNVRISTAGAVARPDVDTDPEMIRDLAFSIIRVLEPRRGSGRSLGRIVDR